MVCDEVRSFYSVLISEVGKLIALKLTTWNNKEITDHCSCELILHSDDFHQTVAFACLGLNTNLVYIMTRLEVSLKNDHATPFSSNNYSDKTVYSHGIRERRG